MEESENGVAVLGSMLCENDESTVEEGKGKIL